MDIELKNQYNEYLTNHINNVKKGFDWLCVYLPELIKPEILDILTENIYAHDRSKYSDEEYEAYANYFYGTKSKEHSDAFDYAWLHHQKVNPHHWEYWILQNDGSTKALEIPDEFILELVCDWWAFSWEKNNLYEIFNYYNTHKNLMILNKKSRDKIENILNAIKNKLDALK